MEKPRERGQGRRRRLELARVSVLVLGRGLVPVLERGLVLARVLVRVLLVRTEA